MQRVLCITAFCVRIYIHQDEDWPLIIIIIIIIIVIIIGETEKFSTSVRGSHGARLSFW